MSEKGNMSAQLAEFLKLCGKCRLNVLISGGTGSGKTTLLNAISQHIGDDERVVTIEDAAELKLQKPHVVRLETKPYQSGQEDAVTPRDLLRNALRMRPDRIIIGEIRGEEAFDFLQAINIGHEGSLTTLHANHPRDALARLENMISLAGLNLPARTVRTQIAAALHLVVQVSRMHDGIRRITYISEIVGMEGDILTMQELAQFVPKGETDSGLIKGEWQWSGIVPRFARRIAYWGEENALAALFGTKAAR
jgi:pilus assembly protein CpaF